MFESSVINKDDVRNSVRWGLFNIIFLVMHKQRKIGNFEESEVLIFYVRK